MRFDDDYRMVGGAISASFGNQSSRLIVDLMHATSKLGAKLK
ncbi:MAG TPA: hypothetical protein VIW21_03100 [Chthoniobacterales bacterium]|jgi:hypothetical protein